MRYAIVIGKSNGKFTAYVPDLPGCVAEGPSVAHVESGIRTAIALHMERLRDGGLPVPPSTSRIEYVDVAG
jgi:predicted RNase H-like HicB family nuclease